MNLEVKRKWFTEESTIGELYVDGALECYTLEDKVREPGVKIPGKTAIAADRYQVIITFSQRFQKMLPLLLAVLNFVGVRIHSGNKAVDTEGCILVGTTKFKDGIGGSRVAFEKLFKKIRAAIGKGEEVWITITDEPVQASAEAKGATA